MATRKKPAPHRHKLAPKPARGNQTEIKRGGHREGAGRRPSPRLAELVAIEDKGTISATMRAYAMEAIAGLVRTLRDPKAPPSAVNAAANHLLPGPQSPGRCCRDGWNSYVADVEI